MEHRLHFPTLRSLTVILSGTAGLLLLAGGPLHAQELCSEPIPPHCIDTDAGLGEGLETPADVTRCRQDVADFADDLRDYETCLKQKLAKLHADLEAARKKLRTKAEAQK